MRRRMSRAICQHVSALAGTRPCQPRGGRTEADTCVAAHHIACTPLGSGSAGLCSGHSVSGTDGRSANARSHHQLTLGLTLIKWSRLMSTRCTQIHMADDHSFTENLELFIRLTESHGAEVVHIYLTTEAI